MAKTKKGGPAPRATKPTKELTAAQRFYLEQFREKPAAELAADLGVPEAEVSAHLEALPRPRKKKDMFARHPSGAVSMTAAQSQKDDEDPALKAPPGLSARARKTTHVIDPDLPVR